MQSRLNGRAGNHKGQETEIMKSRELRARRAKLVEDARALVSDRHCTSEDTIKFDKMMAEADRLKVQIDQMERVETEQYEMLEALRPINLAKAGIATPRRPFDAP